MGGHSWGEEMYNERTGRTARCLMCGIQTVPLVRGPGGGYCGACHTAEHERAASRQVAQRAQGPIMTAFETFGALCEMARSLAKEPKVTLAFWEDASNAGFHGTSPTGFNRIFYVRKANSGGPESLTEWMDTLYQAMGQPEKMSKKPEPPAAPTPKKSVWEWLRKPAL